MSAKKKTEIEVFKEVYEALEPLEEEARERVFTSVATMLGMSASGTSLLTSPKTEKMPGDEDFVDEDNKDSSEYSTFAELYAIADPDLNGEKALVAGYWLQVCQEAENFSGFSINSELNNLGHKLSNVTDALSSFIKTRPQLVLQIKKTGKSRQARKTYKLSNAGIDRVKEMISG